MSVAFLYPGQGSQFSGMLHQLPAGSETEKILCEATEILGQDVLQLDNEEALSSTVAVQLAIFITGIAATKILQMRGTKADVVLGLSVGAFAAAVAAGALSLKDGLGLVKLRAELTEKAYPAGYGLSAVVGLTEPQLSRIVSEINRPESPVFVANLNAPTQIVIAGSDSGMERVLSRAKKEGARTAKRLQVSVPSHCILLKRVADELTRRLAAIEIRTPEAIYITNRRARASRDPERIREDLATNIAHPVRWHDATTIAYERGVRLFVELPPGHTLSDMVATAFSDVRAVDLGRVGFDAAVKLIKQKAAGMA
jgi:malonate decarboxylase epsilon subunit